MGKSKRARVIIRLPKIFTCFRLWCKETLLFVWSKWEQRVRWSWRHSKGSRSYYCRLFWSSDVRFCVCRQTNKSLGKYRRSFWAVNKFLTYASVWFSLFILLLEISVFRLKGWKSAKYQHAFVTLDCILIQSDRSWDLVVLHYNYVVETSSFTNIQKYI